MSMVCEGCVFLDVLRKSVSVRDICRNFIIGYYINQAFPVEGEKAMCDILQDEDK